MFVFLQALQMLSTKRLKEKLKVHQIQSTPFHLLHKFWNIYFNFFVSWFLKMFYLITGIEGVPLFPRQHEKGELQTLVWPFWPLSIFLFIWFFFPLLLHWSFPDLKVVAFKKKKIHSYDRTASAVQLDGARLVPPLINVVPLTLVIKWACTRPNFTLIELSLNVGLDL